MSRVIGYALILATLGFALGHAFGVWPIDKWTAALCIVSATVSASFRGRTDEMLS